MPNLFLKGKKKKNYNIFIREFLSCTFNKYISSKMNQSEYYVYFVLMKKVLMYNIKSHCYTYINLHVKSKGLNGLPCLVNLSI